MLETFGLFAHRVREWCLLSDGEVTPLPLLPYALESQPQWTQWDLVLRVNLPKVALLEDYVAAVDQGLWKEFLQNTEVFIRHQTHSRSLRSNSPSFIVVVQSEPDTVH